MRGRDGNEYYGTSELAVACGVTKQSVSYWMQQGTMPNPVVHLRMGAVWVLDDAFIEYRRKMSRGQT